MNKYPFAHVDLEDVAMYRMPFAKPGQIGPKAHLRFASACTASYTSTAHAKVLCIALNI